MMRVIGPRFMAGHVPVVDGKGAIQPAFAPIKHAAPYIGRRAGAGARPTPRMRTLVAMCTSLRNNVGIPRDPGGKASLLWTSSLSVSTKPRLQFSTWPASSAPVCRHRPSNTGFAMSIIRPRTLAQQRVHLIELLLCAEGRRGIERRTPSIATQACGCDQASHRELPRLEYPAKMLARGDQPCVDLADELPVAGGFAPIHHQTDQRRRLRQAHTLRTTAQFGKRTYRGRRLHARIHGLLANPSTLVRSAFRNRTACTSMS